jgi:twitching motility protein PilI
MATMQTPAELISILRDIERRSKQRAAGLSNSEGLRTWTAIGFRISTHQFLTPLEQSKEVFPVPEKITTVPKSASWVFGIANLRGELLPLFDLNHFFNGKPSKLTKHSRIIIINDEDIYCGVLVDEVYGLKHFEREASPSTEGVDENFHPFVNGSVVQNDILWHVFGLKDLARDSRFLNAAA